MVTMRASHAPAGRIAHLTAKVSAGAKRAKRREQISYRRGMTEDIMSNPTTKPTGAVTRNCRREKTDRGEIVVLAPIAPELDRTSEMHWSLPEGMPIGDIYRAAGIARREYGLAFTEARMHPATALAMQKTSEFREALTSHHCLPPDDVIRHITGARLVRDYSIPMNVVELRTEPDNQNIVETAILHV